MKKEPGDIIILHMRTIMTIIWFIVPEIMELCWNMDRDTEIFFVILGYFLPFYPTNNPKNQNFEKTFKKDLTWRYRHFTLACHKWWSYDVWFLRYGTRWTEFFVILDHFLPFYPPTPPPNNLNNQNFEIMKKVLGDMIILHKFTKNHDLMLYCSWVMAHANVIFIFHFGLFFSL